MFSKFMIRTPSSNIFSPLINYCLYTVTKFLLVPGYTLTSIRRSIFNLYSYLIRGTNFNVGSQKCKDLNHGSFPENYRSPPPEIITFREKISFSSHQSVGVKIFSASLGTKIIL